MQEFLKSKEYEEQKINWIFNSFSFYCGADSCKQYTFYFAKNKCKLAD